MKTEITAKADNAVIVRHAVAADNEDLRPLFAQHRAGIALTTDRDVIDEFTATPNSALLVAEHADGLVGFAVLRLKQRIGLPITAPSRLAIVADLYVAPPHRRAGVGRAFLARARAWAVAMGAGMMEISDDAVNSDAVRFYEAVGYETATRPIASRLG